MSWRTHIEKKLVKVNYIADKMGVHEKRFFFRDFRKNFDKIDDVGFSEFTHT